MSRVLCKFIGYRSRHEERQFVLFVGLAASVTALPVLASGAHGRRLGRAAVQVTALVASILGDLAPLALAAAEQLKRDR
jgi:hypothetical protein